MPVIGHFHNPQITMKTDLEYTPSSFIDIQASMDFRVMAESSARAERGVAFIVFLFAYAILALMGWAEIINIDNWGVPFILNALVMGLFLPLLSSVGIYFGAVEVMNWDWWIGLLLASPGILYTVLGIMGMGVTTIISKLRGAE